MCVPQEKIYNDAPDEFAKFLDNGDLIVSLRNLGGTDNPFVKAGIYKPEEPDEFSFYHATCPICGVEAYADEPADEYGLVHFKCGCSDCGYRFELELDECTYYQIDHLALAEFISNGIGCNICRQFQRGWLFGKLRDYDVYFACSPTAGMYKALESTPKSVLIIGKNTPKLLPSQLAPHVIYLSRLLFVQDGKLNFAPEAIEEKIPVSRRERRRAERPTGEITKKHSRPPIHVYTPYYIAMIREWLEELRREQKTGKPEYKWITEWMHEHCHIQGLEPVGERQIRRHVAKLIAEMPDNPKRDKRSPSFALYWDGCEDENFIARFSEEDVNSLILRTFKTAQATGFKVRPMRGMDAAEYADKVKMR